MSTSHDADARLLTFGHGTASQRELIDLLHHARIAAVIDVRSAPGSKRNPHTARGELQRWLPAQGIDYRWEERLGGFRKLAADSPDCAWRHDSFRAYAGHMRTAEFRTAIDELLAGARDRMSAVMCSESVWWRCHRRMIADFVQLSHGIAVRHLMHDGRLMEHRPIDGARVREDGLLVYDNGGRVPD